MKILESGLIGILGTLATAEVIEQSMQNYDTEIIPPTDSISIIMASYNEEELIERAVSSVRSQSIIQRYPDYFEFILVDSQSKDNTVKIASPYVDKIINAPRGKLTAKNLAIDQANGNIIVLSDSDTYYPYHWLNTLIKPLIDIRYPNHENIIGSVGSTFDYGIRGVPGPIHTITSTIDRSMIHPNQMVGRNCALYKHSFYLSGRYNENVNQLSIKDMINEEERGFGIRLSKLGKIEFMLNASCVHFGGQKASCRIGFEDKEVCKSYGFGKDRF